MLIIIKQNKAWHIASAQELSIFIIIFNPCNDMQVVHIDRLKTNFKGVK